MSSRCTHVGCPTQPNGPLFLAAAAGRADERRRGRARSRPSPPGFGCPCHGSQFDNEGNRTAGPGAARTRPLPVLDPQRPPLARPPLQRQPRRRHRRAGADPQLRAQGRRRARHRPRVVALPDRPAVMSIYELEIGWACVRKRTALPALGAPRVRGGTRRLPDGPRGHAGRALQRRPARLPRVGALTSCRPTDDDNDKKGALG